MMNEPQNPTKEELQGAAIKLGRAPKKSKYLTSSTKALRAILSLDFFFLDE
jgi:hypothetical protein